jgi:RNA polymerase sigma-B factor
VRELLLEYSRTRDLSIRNRLVLRHQRLVQHVVSRFTPGLGSTAEDLFQVGCLGLIAAIERFDPGRGLQFITFAVPTMVGILKHHVRDHGWLLKAPRHLRDLAVSLPGLREALQSRWGRVPTVAEMAEAAGVTEERLAEAMELAHTAEPASLDAPMGGDGENYSRWEAIGGLDPALDAVVDRHVVHLAMARLAPREQAVLRARYYEGAPQSTIAHRLRISQMQVSRIERQALNRLRDLLS